jgi:hypothetical protein
VFVCGGGACVYVCVRSYGSFTRESDFALSFYVFLKAKKVLFSGPEAKLTQNRPLKSDVQITLRQKEG